MSFPATSRISFLLLRFISAAYRIPSFRVGLIAHRVADHHPQEAEILSVGSENSCLGSRIIFWRRAELLSVGWVVARLDEPDRFLWGGMHARISRILFYWL